MAHKQRGSGIRVRVNAARLRRILEATQRMHNTLISEGYSADVGLTTQDWEDYRIVAANLDSAQRRKDADADR